MADHVDHAGSYRRALEELVGPGARIADIGAGGGVPSLPILAGEHRGGAPAGWSMVLADASRKRCSFLTRAVGELDLSDRVSVVWTRIEEWAHEPDVRFSFDAVIARGFGPPSTTVECGVGLLADGGHLVISEPPGLRRWPVEPLAELGLVQIHAAVDDSPFGLAVFRRDGSIGRPDDKMPRPFKQQRSRPLFTVVPEGDGAG